MKRLLMILGILLPNIVHGQIGSRGNLVGDLVDPLSINNQEFFASKYKDISGSPYLENDLYIGSVTLNDSSVAEGLKLQYNGYEDAVLFVYERHTAALLDPGKIRGFEYTKEGQSVRFISALLHDTKKHFYEVIYEGSVGMYVYHEITITKKSDNTGGYGSEGLHGQAFNHIEKYFYLNEEGNVSEVKLRKKSLLDLLDHHQAQMEGFVKENNLKLKDRDDLVQFFSYYDSLIQ